MTKKRALITGITGQDGSYLAELLLEKGYEVVGVTSGKSSRHKVAHIAERITWVEGSITSDTFVRELIAAHKPDEIYNLASVATVADPWKDTFEVSTVAGFTPLFFLEAIREYNPKIKFFQASSAEMYGNVKSSPQNEATPFNPQNPYGIAKLFAHQMLEGHRKQGLFAVSGILFNHESPRRPEQFVTRKITSTLARIAGGSNEVLALGGLDAKRDWSFAGDIVEGMWMSLQHEVPSTYVFASGEVHTVREFVEAASQVLGIDITWKGEGSDEKGFDEKGKVIVEVNPAFYRPPEAHVRQGDITKAKKELGWQPKTLFAELVQMMVEGEEKTKVS
jgi:GDPmannose 4,6-dehydratase